MVKDLDEALERYKKALRRFKKHHYAFFRSLPEGCGVVYLPAEQYQIVVESILHLQGMARVLGLRKREVERICREVGVKEKNPSILIKRN